MVEQSESPEAQYLYVQEQIRNHRADGEIWVDTGLVYRDELTGAVVMNRPDIRRLVEEARAGRFDIVLMKSIKRLGRDTLGLLTLKRFLDDHGIELIGLQDGYRSFRDLELIFLIHADRAQAEREDLARSVRNAMRQRAQQGRWTCGTVPFGYRRRNRHELEPHPETAPIVREMFRLRREGWALDRITRYLNQSEIPPPRWWEARDRLPKLEGLRSLDRRYEQKYEACRRTLQTRRGWHARTVTHILKNTAYYGELLYYRRFWKTLSSQGGRRVLQHRDSSEAIAVPCPPLVTREEWDEAQKRLRHVARANGRYLYLLSGILVCGECGARMTGGGTGHGTARPYYGYYYCTAMRRGLCSCRSVRSERLERTVLAHVAQCVASLERPESIPSPGGDVHRLRIRQLEARLADLRDQHRYFRHEHRRKRITDPELDAELQRVREEERHAEAQLELLARESAPPDATTQPAADLRQAAERLVRFVPSAAGERDERSRVKSLLLPAVDRIVFRREGPVDIHLRLAPPPATDATGIARASVRLFWAEPGPDADRARCQFWANTGEAVAPVAAHFKAKHREEWR
jgi:site-specific DNA recombinase